MGVQARMLDWLVKKVLFPVNVLLFGWVFPIVSVFFMFPLAYLKGEVHRPNRCSNYYFMLINVLWFRVKLNKLAGELKTDERTIFLMNHRTWADFFVHRFVVDTYGAHLSRNVVGAVFPFIWLLCKLDGSIWFFNNRNVRDKDIFYKKLDENFEKSMLRSLVVYPEGARNRKDKPFALRRGVIYYAHSRSIPCQIIITKGYEKVLNEFEFSSSFNATVDTLFGPTIRPTDFESREEFFDQVSPPWRVMSRSLTFCRSKSNLSPHGTKSTILIGL